MQAGFESGITTALAALAGVNVVLGAAGSVDNALSASFEKIVVDNEVCGYVTRLARGIEVNDETLALDVIKEVGPRGQYLTHRHTVQRFRREHFIPELSNRDKYELWTRRAAGGFTTSPERKRGEFWRLTGPRRWPRRWTRSCRR